MSKAANVILLLTTLILLTSCQSPPQVSNIELYRDNSINTETFYMDDEAISLKIHFSENIRDLTLQFDCSYLEGEDKKEEEAESRAFRLAAHAQVSEQVFQQEVGLIRARRRWLEEERRRLGDQLADIERLSFSPDAVESLRRRFEERLARATPKDRRFVLESLGAKVIAHPDGTWDMEIELPRQVQSDLQIEHSVPEADST
jgi:hypothetical protein